MELEFTQGLLYNRGTPIITANGTRLDLTITDGVKVAFAHGHANYLLEETDTVDGAWTGPFESGVKYWLYWDINLVSGRHSYGYTLTAPSFGTTYPTSPALMQHHFNTTTGYMRVWNRTEWVTAIRVFAGTVIDSEISINGAGSQVDAYGNFTVEPIRFYKIGAPVRREFDDGTFTFTTYTGEAFQDSGQLDNFKYRGVQVRGKAVGAIGKSMAISLLGDGSVTLASNDASNSIWGVSGESVDDGSTTNVITRGVLEDTENFKFSEPTSTPLFIDDMGNITPTVPYTGSIQRIGHVVSPTTIFIDIRPQVIIV